LIGKIFLFASSFIIREKTIDFGKEGWGVTGIGATVSKDKKIVMFVAINSKFPHADIIKLDTDINIELKKNIKHYFFRAIVSIINGYVLGGYTRNLYGYILRLDKKFNEVSEKKFDHFYLVRKILSDKRGVLIVGLDNKPYRIIKLDKNGNIKWK